MEDIIDASKPAKYDADWKRENLSAVGKVKLG